MENNPLVSVLMTSYNREKYIAEAIKSVLNSSYQHFELIIVDDGSKDATVQIARDYAAKDDRIQVYVNEENLGDYPNRNKAASLAKGKYLKYLDADDYIYPHGLEFMVSSMEKYPEAALGLCKEAIPTEIFPKTVVPLEAYTLHFLEQKPFFVNSPLTAIIRADKFKEAGGFSGKRHVGDYEFWLKLGAKYPIVKLVPGLGFWRKHEEQENAISRKSLKRPKLNFDVELQAISGENSPFTLEQKEQALALLKKKYSRMIMRLMVREKSTEVLELKNELNLSIMDLLKALKVPSKLK